MNDALMTECDKWLTERVRSRDMPHDFDDVTWVMHDFVQHLMDAGFFKPTSEAAHDDSPVSGGTVDG